MTPIPELSFTRTSLACLVAAIAFSGCTFRAPRSTDAGAGSGPASGAGSAPGSSSASTSGSGAAGTPDSGVAGAAPVLIYDDDLAAGWLDESTAAHDLASTAPVATGARSISVDFAPRTVLQFRGEIDAAGLTSLDFRVNGGDNVNAVLLAYVVIDGVGEAAVPIGPYCGGGIVPTRAWATCRVPLVALGSAGAPLRAIGLQEGAGMTPATVHLDAIELGVTPVPSVAASWIYRDALVAPWTDGSWAQRDVLNGAPTAAGPHSFAATMGPWQAAAFAHPGFSLAGHRAFSLDVHGGTSSAPVLLVRANVNGAWTAGTRLGLHCEGGSVRAGTWTRCDVPLTSIAPEGATIASIAVQEGRGLALPTLYLDEIGFDAPAGSLGAPDGGVPEPAVDVTIAPTSATVSPGQEARFTATVTGGTSTTVDWTVAEGSAGGTVTTDGRYTAPSTAGIFHVVATSRADPTRSATATVTVTQVVTNGTPVPAGALTSRTWTAAGSPYLVAGDLTVPAGQTLVIEPGTRVLFRGHFRMTVTGAIDARGTEQQPIVFTAENPATGWYGLRIWDPAGPGAASPGPQYLEHCIFEYADKQGTNDPWYNDSRGAVFISGGAGSDFHVNHNLFRHNRSRGKGAAMTISVVTGAWTMTGNIFEDNHAHDQGGALDLRHSTAMLTLVGGAFRLNSTDATTGQPNSANGAGGAIVIFPDSPLTLQGVTFSGNTPDDWCGVPIIAAGTVAVSVTPSSVTLEPGASQAFAATVTGGSSSAVTWSVTEGTAGGAITAGGAYTAPAAEGVFHVVATSVADPARSATATVTVSGGPAVPGMWVSAYYVGYQSTLYPPASVDFSGFTHLFVGAVLPRADGTLDTTFYLGATNGPALARDLANRAHLAGRKAIMMVGGAGALAAWQGATTTANFTTFVHNLAGAMQNLGFDGIDLDWEPILPADRPRLLALARALRAEVPGIIIAVPVGWLGAYSSVDPWYAQLAAESDQVNIMSYQMAGAWQGWQSWHSAALAGESQVTPSSISSSANAYLAAGVPRAKLGIGIGFYGTCWRGVTGPRQPTTSAAVVANDNIMSHANIMASYYTLGAYQWDAAASAGSLSYPSGRGPQACTWVSYEDEASIAAKGQWARANGLGGAIIWTVNQGYIASSRTNPLLDATKAAFLR